MMDQSLWLMALGLAVGALGTLIGAGGGFILAPLLLLLYPSDGPEAITSISLAVVFFNALSGSAAYARMGRIDYKSGLLFALATIPGAVFGALTTEIVPRRQFNLIFGIVLILVGGYLLFSRRKEPSTVAQGAHIGFSREIVERNGVAHAYAYNLKLGLGLSTLVGYLSSFLGIGGGIIHVPVLVRLLNFPIHLATATSHFVLAIMALTGTIIHITQGSFTHEAVLRTVYLAVGVLLGAQIGAAFSGRVKGAWIMRCLATALVLVGIRIMWTAF